MDRRQFLFSLAAALVARPSKAQPSEWQRLARHLKGPLVLPSSPDYDHCRRVFNPRHDWRPRGIAVCADADDVRTCVQWASQHGLSLTARSGGHSYEGYSMAADLVVDLSRFNQTLIEAAHARVGPASLLGPTYRALSERGLVFPGGSCPSVGVGGYTLGGGYGLLSRQFGLGCDNLTGAEIVTGDGRHLRVDTHSHPELFWGLRGGGCANFGVVTEMELKLAPLPQVTAFRLEWSWDEAASVARDWMDWAPHADSRISSAFSLVGGSQRLVRMSGLFVGSRAELKTLLPEWGNPKITHEETSRLADAMAWVGGKPGHRNPSFKVFSDMVARPLRAEGLSRLIAELTLPSRGYTAKLQWDSFGGRINGPAADATAFPHRRALACFQALVYWNLDAHPKEALDRLHSIRESYAPYASGNCYGNYVDSDLAHPLQAYFGANLPRLERLKEHYDPHGVLRAPQTVRSRG